LEGTKKKMGENDCGKEVNEEYGGKVPVLSGDYRLAGNVLS
jgi:hypothetical protein